MEMRKFACNFVLLFYELKKFLEIKLVQLQIANLLELKKSILSPSSQ